MVHHAGVASWLNFSPQDYAAPTVSAWKPPRFLLPVVSTSHFLGGDAACSSFASAQRQHNGITASWMSWSGLSAYADGAYYGLSSSSEGAAAYDSYDIDSLQSIEVENSFDVTTLKDGLRASPQMLLLNTLLGVTLSIRPWLDEAIAMEQEAAETGQEPVHTSPWPAVQQGLKDGLRWFTREWLIKFTVRPRLEEAAIYCLPSITARKLMYPLRPHLEELSTISSMFQWAPYRCYIAYASGALYSNLLLKAADVTYTALTLAYTAMRDKSGSRPASWYLRELRAAVLRCGLTWVAGALCAAAFAMVNAWPLKAGVGQFAGEAAAGVFLYPLVLQSLE